MKSLLRALAPVLLCAVLLLSACSQSPSSLPDSIPSPIASGLETPSSGTDIALIATPSRLESAFGQGVWNAISRFAGESGLAAATYKAEEDNESAALSTLELAQKGGAQMVVTLGASVAEAVSSAMVRYPDLQFILLDGPDSVIQRSNQAEVRFAPEQAGWLYGWLAVESGHTALGVVMDESNTSQLYALGFALGAEAAAGYLKLETGAVALYPLLLDEETDPAQWRELADELYARGAQMVFAASADAQKAVQDAAYAAGKGMMGLFMENSQGNLPAGVAASVQHDGKALVYQLLEDWKGGHFSGTGRVTGGIENAAITLHLKEGGTLSTSALKRGISQFSGGKLATRLEETLVPDSPLDRPALEELPLEYLVLAPDETGPSQSTGNDAPVSSSLPPDKSGSSKPGS